MNTDLAHWEQSQKIQVIDLYSLCYRFSTPWPGMLLLFTEAGIYYPVEIMCSARVYICTADQVKIKPELCETNHKELNVVELLHGVFH